MSFTLRTSLTVGLILTLSASVAAAATCSREDIDHYLDRGFSPDQIVDLCGETSPTPSPSVPPSATPSTPEAVPAPKPVTAPPKAPASANLAGLNQEDFFRIKHALDADDVQLTDSDLIYTRDRCHKFGEEDAIGQRPNACVITRTTVSRKGLKVLDAVNGVFLLQDRVFLVRADKLTREVLNPEKIRNQKERKQFLSEFTPHPENINIPLRRGFEPTKIAPTLEKIGL